MSIEEKAIEEGANTVRRYLDPLLQTPLAELGLLLRDRISYWRFKNQVNTALKAKSFLEARGIAPNQLSSAVSPEVVVPLLEASGDASDEHISNMFASLLAGALDPGSSLFVHPSFARVLNQLSSLDARILLYVYRNLGHLEQRRSQGDPSLHYSVGFPIHRTVGYVDTDLATRMNVERSQARLSIENIRRLGVGDGGRGIGERSFLDSRSDSVFLTDYGMSFMKSCTSHIATTHAG